MIIFALSRYISVDYGHFFFLQNSLVDERIKEVFYGNSYTA